MLILAIVGWIPLTAGTDVTVFPPLVIHNDGEGGQDVSNEFADTGYTSPRDVFFRPALPPWRGGIHQTIFPPLVVHSGEEAEYDTNEIPDATVFPPLGEAANGHENRIADMTIFPPLVINHNEDAHYVANEISDATVFPPLVIHNGGEGGAQNAVNKFTDAGPWDVFSRPTLPWRAGIHQTIFPLLVIHSGEEVQYAANEIPDATVFPPLGRVTELTIFPPLLIHDIEGAQNVANEIQEITIFPPLKIHDSDRNQDANEFTDNADTKDAAKERVKWSPVNSSWQKQESPGSQIPHGIHIHIHPPGPKQKSPLIPNTNEALQPKTTDTETTMEKILDTETTVEEILDTKTDNKQPNVTVVPVRNSKRHGNVTFVEHQHSSKHKLSNLGPYLPGVQSEEVEGQLGGKDTNNKAENKDSGVLNETNTKKAKSEDQTKIRRQKPIKTTTKSLVNVTERKVNFVQIFHSHTHSHASHEVAEEDPDARSVGAELKQNSAGPSPHSASEPVKAEAGTQGAGDKLADLGPPNQDTGDHSIQRRKVDRKENRTEPENADYVANGDYEAVYDYVTAPRLLETQNIKKTGSREDRDE